VSRSAVREALRILELSGLVGIKSGNRGGCFIQKVSSNQKLVDYFSDNWRLGQITLNQLTEARYWIESMVIDIVGQKITKKDIEKLRKSIDNAERISNDVEDREKINQHLNFHASLVHITGNTILIDTLSAILELLDYMLRKIKQSRQVTRETFKIHRKILDLLEAGQVERARTLNNAHLKEVSTLLVKLADKHNNLPNAKREEHSFFKKEEIAHVQ
jgi:DNA-binding FadR family transcriptional regulator